MKDQKTRILITGASGFLGSHLIRGLDRDYTISGSYLRHPETLPHCDTLRLDVTDPDSVRDALSGRELHVIVHTAAVSNPDQCEKDRDAAYEINVQGTGNLAAYALEHGILFIYISTDLVFDGERGSYTETDTPRPCNYYAETKLKGENLVRSLCDRWIILRTALMYGWGTGASDSFVDWLSGNLEAGRVCGLFRDQFRSFLYAGDAGPAVRALLKKGVKNRIMHLGGPDRLSRYEFGLKFAEAFGYSRDLIRPILMADLPGNVPRGRDCSLRAEEFNKLGFQPRTVGEGLAEMHSGRVLP